MSCFIESLRAAGRRGAARSRRQRCGCPVRSTASVSAAPARRRRRADARELRGVGLATLAPRRRCATVQLVELSFDSFRLTRACDALGAPLAQVRVPAAVRTGCRREGRGAASCGARSSIDLREWRRRCRHAFGNSPRALKRHVAPPSSRAWPVAARRELRGTERRGGPRPARPARRRGRRAKPRSSNVMRSSAQPRPRGTARVRARASAAPRSDEAVLAAPSC